jgi:hypothetical protein
MAKNGKLEVDEQGFVTYLPRDENNVPQTGFNSNWWLGLEMLHTLFVLEHNSICEELTKAYPDWSSERVFDTARLVNCALMAKIHTTEWTPAILAHPALDVAMHGNWWGVLGEKLYKLLGRVAPGESVSGIPGSGAEQHGAPYSLTEEFVSVYRLHPLIPDNIAFFKASDGEHKKTYPIKGVAFGDARAPLEEQNLGFEDILYSFGINYPGAVTLNNTPDFLRDLHTPEGRHVDMGTIDILRDRERGVPRYNKFRELFHMKPAASFLELTGGNKDVAQKLDKVYEGDVNKVDLLVGCLCEPLPKGFGFSDTAFRVFILMASRRLKSDRYIATDWNEETYSKAGMHWVQYNGMKDVLRRHFPVLGDSLKGKTNRTYIVDYHMWLSHDTDYDCSICSMAEDRKNGRVQRTRNKLLSRHYRQILPLVVFLFASAARRFVKVSFRYAADFFGVRVPVEKSTWVIPNRML